MTKKGTKKTAKQGKGSDNTGRPSELRLEVWGLLFLAVALVLLISLLTYGGGLGGSNNWIGKVGQWIATATLQGFGYSAYLVTAAIGCIGLILSIHRPVALKVREIIGFVLASITCSVLFSLFLSPQGMTYKPGGVTGDLINRIATPFLGQVGLGIIAGLAFILAVVLATHIPPVKTAAFVTAFFFRAMKKLTLWTSRLMALGGRKTAAGIAEAKRRRQEAAEKAEEEKQEALSAIPVEKASVVEEEREPKKSLEPPKINRFEDQPEEADSQTSDDSSPGLLNRGEREVVIERKVRVELGEEVKAEKETEAAEEKAAEDKKQIPPRPIAGKDRSKRKKKTEAHPEIIDSRPRRPSAEEIEGAHLDLEEPAEYKLPPISLLEYNTGSMSEIDRDQLFANAKLLEQTLADYKISGKVVEIHPGPVITMYEFSPARGTKLSKISNLEDDLAMALAALKVRIVAPIPGKSVVGIEVPSQNRETVFLKEIIGHQIFGEQKARLTISLGKDIFGNPMVADLAKMPHVLIAGATGAGKSVGVNGMILSILFRNAPEDVRFILIDPKRLEFNFYEGIPHLLLPVVTDPKQAALALGWVVHEMDTRYQSLSEWGVKNIDSFNRLVKRLQKASDKKGGDIEQLVEDFSKSEGGDMRKLATKLKSGTLPTRMPYIVVVIDELADLMMVAGKEVELSIARLAQLARASGIHLIVATQRPSTDVLTGLIKNNFPARISFRVAQKVDSRVILDQNGAESLLGNGDMLYIAPGKAMVRVHNAYVSEEETNRIVDFVRLQRRASYQEDILMKIEAEAETAKIEADDYDSEYDHAVALVCDNSKASISMLQRKLRVGYNRAARMIEKMEDEGIVGPSQGVKGRQVYGRKIN